MGTAPSFAEQVDVSSQPLHPLFLLILQPGDLRCIYFMCIAGHHALEIHYRVVRPQLGKCMDDGSMGGAVCELHEVRPHHMALVQD